MAVISLGLLLLSVTQVVVGTPSNSIQRINSPSVEENAVVQGEADTVQLTTLSDFGEKYSFGNVTHMIQDMRKTVNLIVTGEQADFLRMTLGDQQFQEISTQLNNSLSETEWIEREAENLNGKRLQPHVILLQRLIKRFSTTQSRLADSFRNLSGALRTASVGSNSFTGSFQTVFLQVYIDFSSYCFKKASEEADHDWRSLASLGPL